MYIQRLKNEEGFCTVSEDNPGCLTENEQNPTKYFDRCVSYSGALLTFQNQGCRNGISY